MDAIYQVQLKDNQNRRTIYLYTKDHNTYYDSYEKCRDEVEPFEDFNKEAFVRAYIRYLAQNN
jgi:hypothetical protein